MTLAGKVTTLVTSVLLIAGIVLLAFLTSHEYLRERDRLVERSTAQLLSQPQLTSIIYFRESKAMQRVLTGFLVPTGAVRYALIRLPDGDSLQRQNATDAQVYDVPELVDLRPGGSPLNPLMISRHSETAQSQPSLIDRLRGGDTIYDLTLPITSSLNPLQNNLSADNFSKALSTQGPTAPGLKASAHVFGYVHLGISRSRIMATIAPQVGRMAAAYLLLMLCISLLIVYTTRRITTPLSRLAQLADDIASGKINQSLLSEASGEAGEVIATLNTVIGGLNKYKTSLDVDRQLLSMKVEERTAQLSRRDQELTSAVQKVSETKDRLRQMAYFDSLTALPNRRLLTEQLRLLLRLAKRNKQNLGLLFLDLDNFKRINDSLGHAAGDLLLKKVGERLLNCVRDSDMVGQYQRADYSSRIDVSRLGGDEFTVVLNQIESAEAAGLVAQRLLDVLGKPMEIEGHEIIITPSIGIAIAPRDAADVEGLLKAADTAMYRAKSEGRNRFVYYASEMHAAGIEHLMLEADLRRAIEREELVLHYQPQVETRTGDIVGVEALLRWQHPEHGLVPPFKFIPLAEEIGLIGELGHWALQEACRQLMELRRQGRPLAKISVNVSALQFNRSLIEQVRTVLAETKLPPSSLVLELTEGIAIDNTRDVVRGLNDLKALGVGLSLDDFGTGYSSLSYLSRFPLDDLKIDRSFVTDFDKSDADASLISAIIAMGKNMNLQLVAEGVETREQHEFLTRQGVTIIQGYLFSKPLPIESLIPILVPGYFMPQITDLAGQGLRALR